MSVNDNTARRAEKRALEIASYINAEWGVAVFTAKLSRDGNPHRHEWQKITAPNPDEIDGWERGLALCALPATGGFTVLDSDPRHGDGLAVMMEELGDEFPEVFWRYPTASGGEHLWVADLGTDRKIGLLPGLDILGKDTIAFIAPTVRPSKVDGKRRMYGVTDPDESFTGKPSDAAIRWVRAANKPKQGSSAESDLPRVTAALVKRYVRDGIPDGMRDDMLARVVFYLCKNGKTRVQARTIYRNIVAASDSRPDDRFGDADFRVKCDSAVAKLGESNGRSYRLTPFTKIKMRPLWWLWEEDAAQRIPGAKLVLIAGHGNVGKSTFSSWRLARLTRGELPGEFYGKPRNCYVAAPEDTLEDTIKPRLVAAGADMRRVFHLDVVTQEYQDGIMISLPSDFGLLEEAIKDKNAVEVYFDSLMSTVDMKYDTHKGRDARQALQPLGAIAARTNCCITGTVHFNKSAASDPAARILESVEVRNVARAILYLAADKDGTHVISCGKGNLGKDWAPLEYAIEDASFDVGDEHYHPGLFVLGDEAAQSADDILRAEGKQGSGESLTSQAAIWLAGYMGEHGNKCDAKAGLDAGEAAGFTKRTIQKAMKRADVISERVGFGKSGQWIWTRVTPQSLQNAKLHISGGDDDEEG